jgi:DNA polymerase I-like protein with 3'-5' exonuclease and polymerase domains
MSVAERHVIEVDVETTGLQWYAHELFMAQFFDPTDEECVVWPRFCSSCGADFDPAAAEVECVGCGAPVEPQTHAVIFRHPEQRDEIQRWLEKDAYFRAWNSKFDFHHLESAGYTLPPRERWEDGMLVAHILDERRSVALQAVGDKMFGTPDDVDAAGHPKVWPEGAGVELEKAVKAWISAENKARRKHSKETGEKFIIANYSDVPDEDMNLYAAHDVELQRRICDAIVPQLDANPDLVGVYELERKVLSALFDVEKLGMGIDRSGAEKLEVELENDLTKIRLDLFELAGSDEFNPNSGPQLEEAFLRRGVDLSHVEKSGKTKRRSMAADVLEGLDDDLARKMEDFRGADKMMSTYVWPLLHDQPDTDKGYVYASLHTDGRLHTDLRQVGARTGRMSSSPNVQNWPRDDLRMRHLVMADEGKKLVAVDLDSIEYVIFAAFLGSESIVLKMLSEPDADIHTHTAEMIGLKPRDRGLGVVESPRQRGKKFNYERIYGGGIKAIKKWHGVDSVTARKWLTRYYEAYPEVEEFQDMIELRLEERGFVKTPWGRRHRAWNPQFAEREAYKFVNYLVQGSAADLFKEAVVRTHEAGIPMIALTHDEILAEVDAKEAPEAMQIIQNFMCDFPKINKLIQVTAGGDIVDRWSQAKDADFDPGW